MTFSSSLSRWPRCRCWQVKAKKEDYPRRGGDDYLFVLCCGCGVFDAGGGGEGIDVLAGGSPCQPYSLANRHPDHRSDDRTELVYTFLDILQELGPTFFMLENVPTFMVGHRHHTATSRIPSPLPRVIARLLEMGCAHTHRPLMIIPLLRLTACRHVATRRPDEMCVGVRGGHPPTIPLLQSWGHSRTLFVAFSTLTAE